MSASFFWCPHSSDGGATLEAKVAIPKLTSVKPTGASRGTVQGVASEEEFRADISGASRLSGEIQAAQTKLRLSGASSVDLTGSSPIFKLNGSGASRAVMEDFAIDSAEVHLSGASSATLNVKDKFGPVSLSGASRLVYLGDPTFKDFHASGASSISAHE